MRRREFITLVGNAAAAWPIATRAEQPARLPTIGFLGLFTPTNEWVAAFVQRLSELRWVVGNTVTIEYRSAIINLKTAKALSLTVPPPLLTRADEVIE